MDFTVGKVDCVHESWKLWNLLVCICEGAESKSFVVLLSRRSLYFEGKVLLWLTHLQKLANWKFALTPWVLWWHTRVRHGLYKWIELALRSITVYSVWAWNEENQTLQVAFGKVKHLSHSSFLLITSQFAIRLLTWRGIAHGSFLANVKVDGVSLYSICQLEAMIIQDLLLQMWAPIDKATCWSQIVSVCNHCL